MTRLRLSVCLLLLTGASLLAAPPESSPQQPAPDSNTAILAQMGELFARNEYAKAGELLRGIPDTAPLAVLLRKHTGLALVEMNLDRDSEVPPHLERAHQVAKQMNEPGAIATADAAEGTFRRGLRQYDLAIAAYQRALENARKAGNRAMEGRIYAQLANVFVLMEDWERSAYYQSKGFSLIEKPEITERFNYAMNQGISYYELYDRNQAEALFNEGLALAIESGGKRNESWARGQLGMLYWNFDKDAAGALNYLNRAIELAREANIPSVEANWLNTRGNVWRDTGEYDRALQDYRSSLDRQPGVFHVLKNTGQVHRLTGRLEEARTMLETLLRERPGQPSPRHLWQAHMELASTYEALGARDRAESEYRQMLDLLEEHRNTSILDAFRSGSFAHSLALYDPYDRYMRFLLAGGGAQPAAAALHVAERARARGFLEAMARVRSSLAAALPPALLEEQNGIMRSISRVQRRLRAPDVSPADRESALKELAAFEQARDAFLVKLRMEQPSLAEARYPEVLEPERLQPALRPGEAAVVFFLSEPRSFRWTVTRDAVAIAEIAGRTAIEAQAGRLRDLLRVPGDLAAVRTEAAALSRQLLEGLDLAPQPVVVVPHGVLHYIPFEVLPHGGSLLVERHAVSYAPSLNSIAHLRRAGSTPAPFRVLAVGNPILPARDAVQVAERSGDVDTVAQLRPLAHAGEELHAIQRTFGRRAEALSGPDARESSFRATDLGRYPVIHFATHGLVSETRPARSGLILSPEASEDGLLQMAEIYRLGLRADLVVLSACETALGREITGEGIVGLTRAFFYAGTRSVIAALWNLNDRFAAEFTERFYAEVRAGRTTEEALRRTKMAYVNHPHFGHPFYWSSLVLTGDGTKVLYRRSPYTLPAVGGAVLGFVAAASLLYRRRRRGVRSNEYKDR